MAHKTNGYIKVFLCDDHVLFRQGIRKLLNSEKDIRVVGEAGNAFEMLRIVRGKNPDVILMDIGMPRMDGITATYKVKELLPKVNIIMLTVYEDEDHVFEAIKAGAMGYLLKDVSIDKVLEAIRRAVKGEALVHPIIAAKVLREFALLDKRKMNDGKKVYDDLTEREKDVLRLLALGGTNKEIAERLAITEKTVKNHITHIFQTLQVNNRTKAALYVLRELDKEL